MADDHDWIVRLREWRAAHEAVHVANAEQLVKDFTELQRRLSDLNHAHEEARRKEGDFASKDEVGVQVDDLVRRLAALQGLVGSTLPRDTFDTAMRQLREDGAKRDDQISGLFTQVQGIAQNTSGNATGSQRVQTLVFALFGAAGIVVGIILALR